MKRSRRELFIDVAIHRGIFKNNLITFFPCFTFIHKAGVSFYCEYELVSTVYNCEVPVIVMVVFNST